jgi:iron uptake system component EfeO
MSSPESQRADGPSRLIVPAVVCAGLLAVAGGVAFYYASQTANRPVEAGIVTVTVGDKACDPMAITVPAGRSVFEIRNISNRPIEWEILDGVMVLDERENIAPGFKSQLATRLKPGVYDITCGLLSNPRGQLTVTASAHSEAERARPPLKAFIGPLSEYKVYLTLQSGELARRTASLAAAIDAGDLEAARAAYAEARLSYRHIETVSGRIADLENVIDPVAAYLAGRENDPGFVGFHRIEYGLWGTGGTDGLKPVANKLAADASALKSRLRALKLEPVDLAGSAVREAQRLADGPIISGEGLYSGNDLAEFAAAVDGLEKPVSLMMPLVGEASPTTAKSIADAFAATRAKIARFAAADARKRYADLPADERKALAASFTTLAQAISKVNATLGME